MRVKISLALVATCATLAFLSERAVAQAMVSGKVDCVVPAGPGGGWDFTCRSNGRLLDKLYR